MQAPIAWQFRVKADDNHSVRLSLSFKKTKINFENNCLNTSFWSDRAWRKCLFRLSTTKILTRLWHRFTLKVSNLLLETPYFEIKYQFKFWRSCLFYWKIELQLWHFFYIFLKVAIFKCENGEYIFQLILTFQGLKWSEVGFSKKIL